MSTINLSDAQALRERFDRSVNKTESCWIWTGTVRRRGGYGRLKFKGASIFAHRLSYTLHKGPIQEGFCVCHKCDNPPCVNPDHLFLGSVSDNNKDRSTKGRYLGEWNGRAKLNTDTVIQILKLRSEFGYGKKRISKNLGLSISIVHDIIRKRSWNHIPRPQKASKT